MHIESIDIQGCYCVRQARISSKHHQFLPNEAIAATLTHTIWHGQGRWRHVHDTTWLQDPCMSSDRELLLVPWEVSTWTSWSSSPFRSRSEPSDLPQIISLPWEAQQLVISSFGARQVFSFGTQLAACPNRGHGAAPCVSGVFQETYHLSVEPSAPMLFVSKVQVECYMQHLNFISFLHFPANIWHWCIGSTCRLFDSFELRSCPLRSNCVQVQKRRRRWRRRFCVWLSGFGGAEFQKDEFWDIHRITPPWQPPKTAIVSLLKMHEVCICVRRRFLFQVLRVVSPLHLPISPLVGIRQSYRYKSSGVLWPNPQTRTANLSKSWRLVR